MGVIVEEKVIGEWKEIMAKELTDVLKENPNLCISNYIGLKAHELDELRRSLEPFSSKYLIVKNSIAKIALEKMKLGELIKFVNGSIGMVLAGDDPIQVVKVVTKFSKSHESLRLKGGYIEGEIIDEDKLRYIASLPNREQLIAKIVYGINSPVIGFVSLLGNTLKKFVYVIAAIKNAKKT